MSDILIALSLLVPIFIVVALLNYASKKQKKRSRDAALAYISAISQETGVHNHYQKQLLNQTVVIDEKKRKLLVIEQDGILFSHAVFGLDEIRDIKMVRQKHPMPAIEKGRKPEQLTTRLGLAITLQKAGAGVFLTFYDHIVHSVFQMTGFEKEALELQAQIIQTKEAFK